MRVTDEAELRATYRRMIASMLSRSILELDQLVARGFALTHMTGYRQPRQEWLEAIESGEMRYHAAEIISMDVEIKGDEAVLVGRNVVTATIYGARGTWRLQLTTRYERTDGRWIAVDTVAATF